MHHPTLALCPVVVPEQVDEPVDKQHSRFVEPTYTTHPACTLATDGIEVEHDIAEAKGRPGPVVAGGKRQDIGRPAFAQVFTPDPGNFAIVDQVDIHAASFARGHANPAPSSHQTPLELAPCRAVERGGSQLAPHDVEAVHGHLDVPIQVRAAICRSRRFAKRPGVPRYARGDARPGAVARDRRQG